MSQRIPAAAVPQPPQRRLVLGLVLASREVGYAVTNGQQLLASGVWQLRKLNSDQAKEARFRAEIGKLLARHAVGRVSMARLLPDQEDRPLVTAMQDWLEQETGHRALRLRRIDRERVKSAIIGPTTGKATHRLLASALARRFPELERLLPRAAVRGHLAPPLAEELPSFPTARERYWQPMFLAIATALHLLAEDLLSELPR